MVLDDRGLNFGKTPWFSRLVEPLVAMKLETVLCWPTRVPW
jgi:hypothetical protein